MTHPTLARHRHWPLKLSVGLAFLSVGHVPPSPNRRRPLQYSSFSPAVVLALLRLPFLRLPFLLLLLLRLLLLLLLSVFSSSVSSSSSSASSSTSSSCDDCSCCCCGCCQCYCGPAAPAAPAACCCRCHRSWCCCCSGEQAETYISPRNVSFETLVTLWFR